jgi:hypothetical protein
MRDGAYSRGTKPMQTLARALLIALIFPASSALAQQWLDYVNREYRFAVNFPSAPTEQAATHRSANGRTIPARVFAARQDGNIYRVTVVPFPADVTDGAAEIARAASLIRPRGQAIFDARGDYDGVAAHDINLVDPAGRQIMAAILYHDHRLYIVEGDVTADAAPPVQFQQSIHITDAEGRPLNLEQGRAR